MNKRIEYIDLAKAITIILVIVGHCYWHGMLLDKLIYAFHMPLFFILSGFFIKYLSFSDGIRKYFHAYIKPYLFTCFIIGGISITAAIITKANLLETIKLWFIKTIFASGWDKGSELLATTPMVGMIWFLVALFWSCVIYSFLKKYSSCWRIIISIVIFSIGCVSVFYIRLPFSIQAGMGGVLFICAGDELRNRNVIHRFMDLRILPKAFMLTYCIVIAIGLGGVSAVTCSYGGRTLPLKIIMCVIACVIVLSACKSARLGGAKLAETLSIF